MAGTASMRSTWALSRRYTAILKWGKATVTTFFFLITQVDTRCFDNKVDSNGRCLKFTQTYDPSYRLRYHAEVVLQNATKRDETEYYGFAFKLADNWQFDESFAKGDKMPPNRIAIAQFISHFRDVDCGTNEKVAVPTTMIWLQNDELKMRLRSGNVCQEENNNLVFRIGRVRPGQWHTLVLGVLWRKDKRGWLKVWYDRKLTIDEVGLKTTIDVDFRLFQFRVSASRLYLRKARFFLTLVFFPPLYFLITDPPAPSFSLR